MVVSFIVLQQLGDCALLGSMALSDIYSDLCTSWVWRQVLLSYRHIQAVSLVSSPQLRIWSTKSAMRQSTKVMEIVRLKTQIYAKEIEGDCYRTFQQQSRH